MFPKRGKPAPKGNKRGGGKKGRSGRKSVYVEMSAAKKVKELFENGMSMEEAIALKEKIESLADALSNNKKSNKTISAFDLYAYKVLMAKDKYLLNIVNKVVGDKILVGEDEDNKFTSILDVVKRAGGRISKKDSE